ncbi:MAG: hypothetical protein NXI08_17330, partial [bacterium]|nr:hypothetical protein [bacterium]
SNFKIHTPFGCGNSWRLGHKPCCGLIESNYHLPLRYAPLELEFTIVSDEHAPVITPVSTRGADGNLIDNTCF